MKKINFFILFIFLFIVSCGNVGKILRNEKIKTTDEFLVKKKDPLILPPDLDKIPEPGSISAPKSKEEDAFKEILNERKKETIKSKKSSSIEEEILRRLPK